MKPQFLFSAAAAIMALCFAGAASAADGKRPPSQCQAIAEALPKATYAGFSGTDAAAFSVAGALEEDVTFTYIGHSTFLIETPGGVSIATDYSGWYRPEKLPTVATMNKAHSTHYTLTPDPGIRYVLHGWSDVPGGKADIHLVVGDTYIHNVTTDIRHGFSGAEADGNSIFIFEVAGLCIGHLGHLHYELTDRHYAEIGRLDVVMVPVDGGLTMGSDSMSRVIRRLRSSLILPMHQRAPLPQFLSMFDGAYDIAYATGNSITVSMRTLPRKPLIHVPLGMQ